MPSTQPNAGFTLVEVVVSLLIATLIVGGVMGLASISLRQTQHMKEKLEDWPILEAAAQRVLAHPEDVRGGMVDMGDFPGAPKVQISLVKVEMDDDRRPEASQRGELYRVQLDYNRQLLEFSIIIPRSAAE